MDGRPAALPGLLTEEQYAAKREVVAATLASAASVEVDAAPIWPRGQPFDLFVTVHNLIDGHAFPTGSTFNRQVWLEVVARDAEGTVLFETGTLDDNGDLRNYFSDLDPFGDEDLVLLSSGLTDLHGDPTYLSWTAWEHTSGALSPGYERTWTLFVPTHLAAQGDITIEARLRFRQLPPYLLRAVGLESYIDRLEIFDMASGSVTVELTAGEWPAAWPVGRSDRVEHGAAAGGLLALWRRCAGLGARCGRRRLGLRPGAHAGCGPPAGLTLFPKLEVDRGLVLRARVDTRLCITTAPLDYAIDIVFADHLGEVKAVACDRSPTDATVCAEDVRDVLELLPRPGCEGWVGGQLVVEP